MVESKFSPKLMGICFISLMMIFTIIFCVEKPKMHKTLQFNIIEYFLKINTDGSTATTKQSTTTGQGGE